MEKNHRDVIKVFNIYHLLYINKQIYEEIDTYPDEHIDVITSSISVILDNMILHFSSIFSILRPLYQLITGKTKISEFNISIDSLYKKQSIKEFFEAGHYDLCFNKLVEEYSNDLNIIIFLKNIKIDKVELMKMVVSDSNEYNWANTLENILAN